MTGMYKPLNARLFNLWQTARSAKIDIRMMRRIMQRPMAQLAAIIQPAPRAQADAPAQTHIDPGRRWRREPSFRLDQDNRRRFPNQHLLFGGFHRSRRLDVPPANVTSKHLLEYARALQKSRRDNRQREMAPGTSFGGTMTARSRSTIRTDERSLVRSRTRAGPRPGCQDE